MKVFDIKWGWDLGVYSHSSPFMVHMNVMLHQYNNIDINLNAS
jgi:hypothetical protein